MENMTDYQYAWMMYLIGAVGCSVATGLLFRRAGRAWTHFFVITVMVILLTPYAVDAETMIMAPAMYTVVFGYLDGGFMVVKPVIKLMLGLWVGTLVLSLLYQLLTRNSGHRVARQTHHRDHHQPGPEDDHESAYYANRPLTREERLARDELLHEEPIRALRD